MDFRRVLSSCFTYVAVAEMTARAWGLLSFAVVLLLASLSAHAVISQPATKGVFYNGVRYAGQAEACAANMADIGKTFFGYTNFNANGNGDGLWSENCQWSANTSPPCGVGTTCGVTAGYVYQEWVCPDSTWTRSGQTCTHADCPAAGSSAMIGGAQAWGITGSSATCTTGIAYGGCKITCTSGVSAGGKASCTACTFTGGASTTSDASADPTTGEEKTNPDSPEECLARGMGYVTTSTGTTCVSADKAPEPLTTKKVETTTTKNGSGTTTGIEDKSVDCVGDKCTTTTTTKDGTGTVTGTTTNTGTGDKAGTNPEDKQSECDKHPETIGCSQYGTPVEDGPLTTQSVGTSSLSPALGSGGSCPSDISLPKGMKFSWEYVCMYASGIRPVVIALAWLSAGFLLFGMRLD